MTYGPTPRPLLDRYADVLDFHGPVPEFDPELGPCWLWTLGKGRGGYGKIKVAGHTLAAHKVMWELLVGNVEQGMQLDHLCRVPHCCNPDHLEEVTPSVNKLRTPGITSQYAGRTHCSNGHEYAVTGFYKRIRKGVECRECKPCMCAAQRRYQQRLKAL